MTNPLLSQLPAEECWEILQNRSMGRIALYTGANIEVTPVRYVILEGKFYFQMVSREKLSSIVVSRMATLEIDHAEDDGALSTVIVRGTAHWHTHEIGLSALDGIRFGSVPDEMNWVEFVPEKVLGNILTPQQVFSPAL